MKKTSIFLTVRYNSSCLRSFSTKAVRSVDFKQRLVNSSTPCSALLEWNRSLNIRSLVLGKTSFCAFIFKYKDIFLVHKLAWQTRQSTAQIPYDVSKQIHIFIVGTSINYLKMKQGYNISYKSIIRYTFISHT